MVLHAITENFRCAEVFLLRTRRFFLLFSAQIATCCQQNKQSLDKLEIPCGTTFLRVQIFCDFSSDRQEEDFAKKNHRKHFPRKNLLQSKHTLTYIRHTKYSTKKLCLFNHNLPLSFRTKRYKMNYWFYSQTRSSVPVANELMNSFTEK